MAANFRTLEIGNVGRGAAYPKEQSGDCPELPFGVASVIFADLGVAESKFSDGIILVSPARHP